MNASLGTCPRCGIRRAIKPERGEPYACRDCPPEKPWDDRLTEDDVAPIRWVRDGLVWRAEPVENALETRGFGRNVWDNEGTRKDGPGGALTPLFPGLADYQGVD